MHAFEIHFYPKQITVQSLYQWVHLFWMYLCINNFVYTVMTVYRPLYNWMWKSKEMQSKM